MSRTRRRLVDLSQPIRFGQVTHPGLPAPAWEAFRSREDYRRTTGTEFQVDRVVMVGNTGTYLDSPFHRFAGGDDLAALPLRAVVDLPVAVVDVWGRRAVDADLLERRLGGDRIAGAAVLLYTGGDAAFGTAAYAHEAPYLTADGAAWLADRGPALVGIDAVNIDDLDDPARPAHPMLLGRGVLVLEHLTGLANVPARGARLHAAPPAWHGVGTWPVRAYAVIEEDVT
jgi:kynurenine formamidase